MKSTRKLEENTIVHLNSTKTLCTSRVQRINDSSCVYYRTTTRQAKRNYRLQYAEVRCSGKNSQINGLRLIFSHSNHHLKYAQRQLIALKLPVNINLHKQAFIMGREHQFKYFLVIIFSLIVFLVIVLFNFTYFSNNCYNFLMFRMFPCFIDGPKETCLRSD